MISDNLTSQLDAKSLKEAYKDIWQIMRIHATFQREYARGQADITDLQIKYNNLIKKANKKYKGLFFKLQRTSDDIKLRIFIRKDKTIKDVFLNSASKINGLKSIGTKSLGEIDISHSDEFNKKLENAKSILFISYSTADFGTQTLILEHNKNQKMVELLYDIDNIQNEAEPDFKIFSYYALSEGYDDKIDLYKLGAQIAIPDLLYYKDRKEYLEKFDPRFLE